MVYRVKKEVGYNGTKTMYSVGQKLMDSDIQNIKNRFNGNPYEIKDTKDSMDIKFFDTDIFKQRFVIYNILLEKIRYNK